MVERGCAEARGQRALRLTGGADAVCMDGMWLEALRLFLYGLVVLSLAGIAFVAGVFTAKKLEKPPMVKIVDEVPSADRQAARDAVEAALAARFTGSNREALGHLEDARRLYPAMRGLAYQFGLTYLDLGDYEQAEASAKRSVERDEETSNAQALRGLILLQKARAEGQVAAKEPEIMARLRESRETDPLNPMPLYIMGEAYRAAGRPELAVDPYRRALERVSKTDSYLVTTVKAGLAGLRLNHKDSNPPLKLQEINGVLPPEQLFFGAADALLRGDKAAASGYLAEARTRMPAKTFEALLQDSFFQDYLDASIVNDPQTPDLQP